MPIIAPAFACAGLGWLWVKHGRPFDLATVTTLVTYIGAPCLIFSSLVRLSVSGEALAEMALAAVLALGVFAVLGGLLLRVLRLPAASYLSPLVFANTGNMGLPLCLFAFGEAGLELAVVFFAVSVVGILVLGAQRDPQGMVEHGIDRFQIQGTPEGNDGLNVVSEAG